jgi:hypothetical protein
MTTKEKLSAIGKIILGKAVIVELAQMKLADGVTVLEADSFEAGMEVYVVTPDGNVPVPVGEYELENGMILVVATEGMIEEIKEAAAEEEAVTPEQPEEAQGGEPAEEAQMERQPKRTIESVVKEHHFSSEIETLKAELSALKAEKEALAKELDTKKVELSTPAVEPISYNPENESKVEVFRYSSKKNQSSVDRVLGKLY